jgi:hypothetical protein
MTNAFSLFRSLVIYSICLPLAILIGYLLATPNDPWTYSSLAILLMLMSFPLFLRWHYPWLLLSWNMVGGLYFLSGKPSFALIMTGVSFGISSLTFIMNRNLKFPYVPFLVRPLIFLSIVVILTAELRGGFGLHVLGSEDIGGKRYVLLLSGVAGFFALTAQSIPARKSSLYSGLYFLGGITAAVSNLASFIDPSFYFIFLFFPPEVLSPSTIGSNTSTIVRLSGLAVTSMTLIFWLLARYGLQGILDPRKYWRFLLFVFFVAMTLLGGFRSMAINIFLVCAVLFYFEGLMRTRLLPTILLAAILLSTVAIPFANKLPLAMQRSLTFLPLDLDPEAEMSSKDSTGWRLEMWSSVLPEVPKYLILGKGYGIDANDLDMLTRGMNRGEEGAAGAIIAGDYHNGPLSIIIPFGILGVAGFVWFLAAGCRALYRNYRFGKQEQERINRFLLTFFIVKIIMFFLIVGSLYSDFFHFAGIVGLSVALNGGVRSPVSDPVPTRQVVKRFSLVGATR